MRKLLISTLLTLCASSLPPATVRATVKSLNVPQHYQEKSWWCWDATINMVMRYYSKHWAEQCEVAEVARTHESTGYFGTTPCCLNPNVGADPLRDPMCNRGNWGGPTNGEMRHLLAIYGFPTTSWTGTKLPLDQAKTELNANRPFIIGYPGHVVVGRGFDDSGTSSTADDKIYLNDPWFDNGQQWRLYTDMADWTDTLKISAPASSDEKAILYQNTSYGGTSMTVTSSVSDLGAFSNQASSAAVRGAPYIFYDLTSYGAPGWPVVPDDYSTYTKWGETTDNQVSSVAKMPSANLHTAAVLYSGQNFTGTQTIITGDTTSIAVTAQSVIINNKIWQFYTNTNYAGSRTALTSFGGPGRNGFYPNPASWGSGALRSVRKHDDSALPLLNGLLLCDGVDLTGRCVFFYPSSGSLNDLSSVGFDNMASSARTFGNQWTAYPNVNQGGAPLALKTQWWHRTLTLNNAISSLAYADTHDYGYDEVP